MKNIIRTVDTKMSLLCNVFHLSYLPFILIFCGVYVIEGIRLQLLTENFIKGKPIGLFCNIHNFTNLAQFVLPDGLPIRSLFCNNRNGCSINTHKLFNVNSNSTGLILTLKNISETMEGKYECIYKERKATYLLDIASQNVIDPKNGCKLKRSENGYNCKTECVMLQKKKWVYWEFKTVNKILTWTSSARSSNDFCSKKKAQYVSQIKKDDIKNLNGTLSCYITLSEDLKITSPSIRVLGSAKEYKQETTSNNVPLFATIILAIAILVMVLTLGIIIGRRKTQEGYIAIANLGRTTLSYCTFGK